MKSVILFPSRFWGFIREVYQELRMVEFPSRPETIRMTAIILVSSILLGVILLLLDTIFVFLRNYITTLNVN